MNPEKIQADLKNANRLRCVTSGNRTRYRLRIEDVDGVPLTEFVDLSKAESAHAVQLSTIPVVTPKENLLVLPGGDEDYRLPIVNDATLRARLYPTVSGSSS
jgi:hypothetical protein